MAPSKSTRIIILLAIDTAFFFLELITGYAVHSLALVADSFHMLNDVLSLLVGLWAVKMANRTSTPKMYTYGYQRAETLGALVNGVFLVALCVTIFLDAVQRFVEPQEVKKPQIVLVVGCLGLLSNMVGLLLFHDHSHGGHSHGGGGHSHSHGNEVSDAEEGHAEHTHPPYSDQPGHAHSHGHGNSGENDLTPQVSRRAETAASGSTAVEDFTSKTMSPQRGARRHSRSASRGIGSLEEFAGPGAFRNSIIAAGRMEPVDSDEGEETEDGIANGAAGPNNAFKPLLATTSPEHVGYGATQQPRKSIDHAQHNHRQPKEGGKGGGGHSHGDLNMKGIFLHVMGDALGNIGVIATALIIWLTNFKGRFYFDPAISLVITIIILCSAIPLCKAASRILLQAVPAGIEVDDIQADIEDLPGIESCHHLHVWQLSDTKLVASLHVRVTFNFKGEGSQRYMELAAGIRKCLHEWGIHSSTIQPEFHHGSEIDDDTQVQDISPRNGSVRDDSCLLECDDNCGGGKSCCPPAQQKDDHSHDGHGHDHLY